MPRTRVVRRELQCLRVNVDGRLVVLLQCVDLRVDGPAVSRDWGMLRASRTFPSCMYVASWRWMELAFWNASMACGYCFMYM